MSRSVRTSEATRGREATTVSVAASGRLGLHETSTRPRVTTAATRSFASASSGCSRRGRCRVRSKKRWFTLRTITVARRASVSRLAEP